MAKRHHTTISAAFEHITVDGVRLDRKAAHTYFQKLARTRKVKKHAWTGALADTVMHLTLPGAPSLPATTSGTTGPPKHVNIPRHDLVNSARLTAATFGLDPGDRALLCLPCDFIAGKMMVVRAFALGLDLHIIDPSGSVVDALHRNDDHFRFTAMVPAQLLRALREDRERVGRQFDTILLGGGPVSEVLVTEVQGLDTKVFHGYGSTETVTHVALRALNGPQRSDRFHAIGQVTFSVDKRGRLLVRTPHLSVKEHATNDLVELIDATHFRWLGRADNVILSGGKKIFPEQLERRSAGLLPYPHYFAAAPHAVLGQAVVLIAETHGNVDEITLEARSLLKQVLHEHELPRAVHLVTSLRRTKSGKIVRS